MEKPLKDEKESLQTEVKTKEKFETSQQPSINYDEQAKRAIELLQKCLKEETHQKQVYVLALYFDKYPGVGGKSDCEEVVQFFKQNYEFDGRIQELYNTSLKNTKETMPTQDPLKIIQFNSKIIKLVIKSLTVFQGQNNLLILYYSGHGKFETFYGYNTIPMLYLHNSPAIESKEQMLLFPFNSFLNELIYQIDQAKWKIDILVILDCCAAHAGTFTYKGDSITIEFLCACGATDRARMESGASIESEKKSESEIEKNIELKENKIKETEYKDQSSFTKYFLKSFDSKTGYIKDIFNEFKNKNFIEMKTIEKEPFYFKFCGDNSILLKKKSEQITHPKIHPKTIFVQFLWNYELDQNKIHSLINTLKKFSEKSPEDHQLVVVDVKKENGQTSFYLWLDSILKENLAKLTGNLNTATQVAQLIEYQPCKQINI